MLVGRICYPVKTLGPGNRVGIWVVGCNQNCIGCMSPELRDCSQGVEVKPEKILELLREIENVDGVTISGGEPFLQVKELISLVELISDHVEKDILIYTGFQLKELEQTYPMEMEVLKKRISAIVDGPYIEAMNRGRGLMGSENQQTYIYHNFDKYRDIRTCERSSQAILYNGQILLIGIQ